MRQRSTTHGRLTSIRTAAAHFSMSALAIGVLSAGMLSISGCSLNNLPNTNHQTTIPHQEVQVTESTVIKSPADSRDYRHITLANGLNILLISDADTDKAAVAVDVQAGSYQDPDDRLGLAHFLEHMLFMGTDKYPDVDGYHEFIKANGGMSNAYTADDHTNYYFDINSDQLQPAMDRLAQFFIAPKLDPAYIEREKNAVDSEYKLHAREDMWRLYTAQNATANPAHPRSRFKIGSLETLKNDDGQLWNKLQAFYQKYYVAPNMGVVVYGKESLDQLQKWATESFAAVQGGQKPNPLIGIAPYTADEQQVRINLIPLKDTRVLSLSFTLPSSLTYYRIKPQGYLSRIIGYEGEGSLHSYLKDKGWIDSLSSYTSDQPHEYSEFVVRMELTPKGLTHVDGITAVVFDYIELIRQQGLSEALYQEGQQTAELAFRFKEKESAQQTASGLATMMHHLPAENLLNANYLYEFYDEALIRAQLQAMTPANLRQAVIAQGLETNKVEPYFGTQYSVQPLSDILLKRLNTPQQHAELTIPTLNPFIAEDLSLKTNGEATEPHVVIDKKGLKLWSMTDTSFEMPKGVIRIMISTDKATASAANDMMTSLYQALLSRDLNEYGYPAKEAGLNYSIRSSARGLQISLSGYQDKQPKLLAEILKAMDTFKVDPQAFEQEKAFYIQQLSNKQFLTPYRLGFDALARSGYPSLASDENLLAAAKGITLAQFEAFRKTLFDHIHVEMMVYGNYSEAEAVKIAELVEQSMLNDSNRSDRFNLLAKFLGDRNEVDTLTIDHADSMIISYYQMPSTSNRERAKYALLGSLLATPFFNSLRTEQQLGYVVFASARPFEKHPGIVFVVQSPKMDTVGLEACIDLFLAGQVEALKTLDNAELEVYRQGLISNLLKKDANMKERYNRFWMGITSDETDFNNREAIAAEVASMTPDDMRAALARLLENRGKLITRSEGNGGAVEVE